MIHKVTVHGKSYEVTARQKSKSVWVASGGFDQVLVEPGKTKEIITAQGGSEGAAVIAWRRAAEYRGN